MLMHLLFPTQKKNSMDNLCFYVFGVITFFNMEMLFIASQDILSGRNLPTATILVCYVTPLMITKIFAPWFVQRISYLVKVSFIALWMMLGMALIVFVEDIRVKLVGITLNAMAAGMSEVIFLALTSFYPQIAISSFLAGTGSASLISQLYYTSVTTWSCAESPKTAIMIVIPLPLSILVSYAMLDKGDISNGEGLGTKVVKKAKYTAVSMDELLIPSQRLSYGEKFRIGRKIICFIIPLFFSFFAEYLANSSVITTIAFPNSQVLPRDHFLYYSLSYCTGKFLGRSYLLLFAWLSKDLTEFLFCDRTWIFAVLEIVLLIFFLFQSWYHFVSFIWIIVCLCFTLGLVSGMIYLHSPHAVARHVEPEEKEFALGLITVGNSVGAFVGGLVGLIVESYLVENCVAQFSNSKEFCFTRHKNTSGWGSNIHCSQ
ncbi:protein BTN1-like [Pocillopora damicornis]|uniref:protein BTN1-like n=1 Tax=Pocillopora damicornis TaxID=46731 RepID=UPI000F5595F3|nr:protein BTN1-like [Pocillopora damicornis]